MTTNYDFHTHTHYLRCANETMTIERMAAKASELGVSVLGVTDHLNTLEKLPLHRCILSDLQDLDSPIDIYFGVELNFMALDGDFAFNEDVRDELGFQFAIGGIHGTYCDEYDLAKIMNIQHRHHLRTCENPLVDVLVHPYWFGKGEFDNKSWPWFDDVSKVPESYARELGQVARDTGTAVEINGCANLENPANPPEYVKAYEDYLRVVAAEGCLFSTGSDAHDINRMSAVQSAWAVAERVGIPAEKMWRPSGEPLVKGR